MPNKRIVTKKVRNDGTTVKTVSRQKQNKDGTTSYTEKIKRKGKDGKRISKVKSKGTYNTKTGKTISDNETVKKYKAGGSLKSVPKSNKGLGKLPEDVRNKMGYMMYGGSKIKKMKDYMYGGKKVPGMFQQGSETLEEKTERGRRENQERKTERGDGSGMETSNTTATKYVPSPPQAKNWNKKLTRLTDKRTKRKAKGKSTTRVQKRITKEMKKIGN